MSYLFSFPRYHTKCIIKFLFSQLMMSQTIRLMLDQPPKQWLTLRKRGEYGNKRIWISWEQNELFRWNNNHFSWFLKSYPLVKNKSFKKSIMLLMRFNWVLVGFNQENLLVWQNYWQTKKSCDKPGLSMLKHWQTKTKLKICVLQNYTK